METWIDEGREPKVYKLDVEGLTLKIHRIKNSYGWFLYCPELSIVNYYLDTDDLEKAKKDGLKIITKKIEELIRIKKIIQGVCNEN